MESRFEHEVDGEGTLDIMARGECGSQLEGGEPRELICRRTIS